MGAVRDRKPGFDSEIVGCFLKIKLRGEIDHHCAASVRNAIDAMIYEKRPRGLVLDMSAVDFMDSSGLGLIMGRYSVMKELGGETTVLDPNAGIEKIIRLAGMERVIKVERSSHMGEHITPPRRKRTRAYADKKSLAELEREAISK